MPRMAAAVPRLDDAQLRGLVGLAIFKFNLSHSGLKFGSTYINVNGQDANLFLFLCGSFAAGYQFLSKPFSAEAVREYFVSHALEYVVMYYVGLFAFAAALGWIARTLLDKVGKLPSFPGITLPDEPADRREAPDKAPPMV